MYFCDSQNIGFPLEIFLFINKNSKLLVRKCFGNVLLFAYQKNTLFRDFQLQKMRFTEYSQRFHEFSVKSKKHAKKKPFAKPFKNMKFSEIPKIWNFWRGRWLRRSNLKNNFLIYLTSNRIWTLIGNFPGEIKWIYNYEITILI